MICDHSININTEKIDYAGLNFAMTAIFDVTDKMDVVLIKDCIIYRFEMLKVSNGVITFNETLVLFILNWLCMIII